MYGKETVVFEGKSLDKDTNHGDQSPKNKKKENEEKINKLVSESNRVLFQISSFFPFDFFPDKVIIDEKKLNIIKKPFFKSEQVNSLPYEDIKETTIEASIFFATLQVFVDQVNDPFTVRFLKKQEAFKARRLIEGLAIMVKEQIDFSNFSPEELAAKAEEIGKSHGV